MTEETKKLLAVGALIGGGALLLYNFWPEDKPRAPVGPGGNYNGWINNTGQPTWVTTTGLVIGVTGQVLGFIEDIFDSLDFSPGEVYDDQEVSGFRLLPGGM